VEPLHGPSGPRSVPRRQRRAPSREGRIRQ
jgi:hypothetical protein